MAENVHGMNANDLAALGMVMERFGFNRSFQDFRQGGGFQGRNFEPRGGFQDRGEQHGGDRQSGHSNFGGEGSRGGEGGGSGERRPLRRIGETFTGSDGIVRTVVPCDVCQRPTIIRKESLDQRRGAGDAVTCREHRGQQPRGSGGGRPGGGGQPGGPAAPALSPEEMRTRLETLARSTGPQPGPAADAAATPPATS